MRMSAYVITALLAAGLPTAAMAQGSTNPAAVPPPTQSTLYGTTQSHWIASGFVGSSFGGNVATDASVDFGGQVAYLWKGVVGGEALADFAPSFKADNIGLSQNPRVNGYMGNAIAALPLGGEGQFQPYVSGGLGTIQMRADVLNAALPHATGTLPTGTTTGNEARFGSDIGGGVMGFAGMLGFRADVRYYKTTTNNSLSAINTAADYSQSLLSGLAYWRANIGFAVRW